MDVPTHHKPLVLTDCAINIYPTLEDKVWICQNAIDLAHTLGVALPKVAVLSAVETVNPKITATLEAAAKCKMADRGQITGGLVDGPLAMDNAISKTAAEVKHIRSEVAGDADILVVPDLEAGNMLGQATDLHGQRGHRGRRPRGPRAGRSDQPLPTTSRPGCSPAVGLLEAMFVSARDSSAGGSDINVPDTRGSDDTGDWRLERRIVEREVLCVRGRRCGSKAVVPGPIRGDRVHPSLLRQGQGQVRSSPTNGIPWPRPHRRKTLCTKSTHGSSPIVRDWRLWGSATALSMEGRSTPSRSWSTNLPLDALAAFVPLAPSHQPHNLAPILRFVPRHRPGLIQVACFDTAFHRTAPLVANVYGLPREYIDAGVGRYGFHGLSFEYVTHAPTSLDPVAAAGRVVIAHLGNGCSMAAVLAGKSLGDTMGFTVLDGLPMGTRCGQIDPGVLDLLAAATGHVSPHQMEDLLYNHSGLKGLSGVSNASVICRPATVSTPGWRSITSSTASVRESSARSPRY